MIRTVILAMAAAMAAPALAQGAPDPAAQAAALEVMKAANFEQAVDIQMREAVAQARSTESLSRQIDAVPPLRAARAKNPKAWSAALGRIGTKQAAALQAVLAELRPAYRTRIQAAYARTFTVAELHQLAAFYRSPLGAKFNRAWPQALGAANSWMAQQKAERMAKRMVALRPQLDAELAPLMPKPASR